MCTRENVEHFCQKQRLGEVSDMSRIAWNNRSRRTQRLATQKQKWKDKIPSPKLCFLPKTDEEAPVQVRASASHRVRGEEVSREMKKRQRCTQAQSETSVSTPEQLWETTRRAPGQFPAEILGRT